MEKVFTEMQFRYGNVRAIPKNVEDTRTIPFVISSAQRDRHGTVLNPDGWKIDNYLRNPIVGLMHEVYGGWNEPDIDNVVGKNVKIDFEGENDQKVMIGDTMFEPAEINPQAERVFRKVLFGSLNAVSVGFDPIGQGRWGVATEAIDGENPTYYFSGQELYEYSIVMIPSNPGATKRKLGNTIEGAVNYAFSKLGNRFSRSQIEEMPIRNIMLLLEGRDAEIRSSDPDHIQRLLIENDRLTRENKILKLKNGLTAKS